MVRGDMVVSRVFWLPVGVGVETKVQRQRVAACRQTVERRHQKFRLIIIIIIYQQFVTYRLKIPAKQNSRILSAEVFLKIHLCTSL